MDEIKIKIIGVGGGGTNAVNRMIESGISGVEYATIITDGKGFKESLSETKIQIGKKETDGRGAGAEPERGFISANENRKEIGELVRGCDMLFITAGMGGGTGTGASPVVAQIAKELGILTVAVVTTPFAFEGKRRMDNAVSGIEELKKYVDAVVVVPNENLKKVSETRLTLANAFEIADSVLMQTVMNIVEVIQNNAYINCDFADIRTIIKDSNRMFTATGFAKGEGRGKKIVSQITESTLLGSSVKNANNILLCITVAKDASLDEIDNIVASVLASASETAFVIYGINFDESMDYGMKAVLLATEKCE